MPKCENCGTRDAEVRLEGVGLGGRRETHLFCRTCADEIMRGITGAQANAGGNALGLHTVRITAGPFQFTARFETEDAPQTCAAFEALLPFRNKIIQARWSGESAWIPLGDFKVGVGFENHTSHPAPGEILLYPGGFSETEILFPYGATMFASKMGQLAGNHFLTIIEGREHLRELGRTVVWEGAQDIVFERE